MNTPIVPPKRTRPPTPCEVRRYVRYQSSTAAPVVSVGVMRRQVSDGLWRVYLVMPGHEIRAVGIVRRSPREWWAAELDVDGGRAGVALRGTLTEAEAELVKYYLTQRGLDMINGSSP